MPEKDGGTAVGRRLSPMGWLKKMGEREICCLNKRWEKEYETKERVYEKRLSVCYHYHMLDFGLPTFLHRRHVAVKRGPLDGGPFHFFRLVCYVFNAFVLISFITLHLLDEGII